jgi:hypothetical protein
MSNSTKSTRLARGMSQCFYFVLLLLTCRALSAQNQDELCKTAQQRDEKRGPINIKRLHSRYNGDVWRNNSELIELVR